MMLTVMYSLLGGFGYMIYRGMKKNEEYRNSLRQVQMDGSPPLRVSDEQG